MPFTAAHPAAILPLVRPLGRLAAPGALVVGSLAPDLAYFLPLQVGRAESHSVAGLFWFCLPVGLAAYAAFYLLVAPLVQRVLPSRVGFRLPEWAGGQLPPASFPAIAVSLLVGAVTHLVWDSFTHCNGAVVLALPVLGEPLLTWQGYTLYVFKVLQHGSTVVGIAALVWWGHAWLRSTPLPPAPDVLPPRSRVSIAAALLGPPALFGLVIGASHLEPEASPLRQLQQFLGHGIIAGGTTFLVWLLVMGVIDRVILLPRRRNDAAPRFSSRL